MVILCQSDVAKGVMASRLRGGTSSSTNNQEIVLFQWSYRPLLKRLKLHFNTWVLGSSSDYSSMYPVFFSQSALYLIVWDMTGTGEMREQIKMYVDLLARYVPNANILVMVILPEPFEAWADANYENLRKRLNSFFSKPVYRSLHYHGLAMMSTTVRDTQVDVKQKIYEIATTMTVNGQQLVGRCSPENYFNLISVVEKEQQNFQQRGKPCVLEENALWSLFERALPSDSPDRMELPVIVDFLQDAGVLMHFPDPNDRLDQYYFLKPDWLYFTLLRVLRHALQDSEHLMIGYTDLCNMANLNWSKHVTKALIRLMVRYAIVLPIKSLQQLLIPHLLPHCNPSSSHLHVGSLRLQFAPKTKALPSDLWYRIICRILASLHRITEMKTLKRKASSPPSGRAIKESQERENSPERQVESDEESNEQTSLKQQNAQRLSSRDPRASSLLATDQDESSLDFIPRIKIVLDSPDTCPLPEEEEVVLIIPNIDGPVCLLPLKQPKRIETSDTKEQVGSELEENKSSSNHASGTADKQRFLMNPLQPQTNVKRGVSDASNETESHQVVETPLHLKRTL